MKCAYFEYAGLEDFRVCDSIETAIGIAKAFAQTLQFFHSESKAAAKLAACVAMEYGIPLDHILRHGDITTKNCPSPLKRDQGLGSNWTWAQFKERVAYYMDGGADDDAVLLKVGD